MARRRSDDESTLSKLRRSPLVGGIALLVIVVCTARIMCDRGAGGKMPKYDFVCATGSCAYADRLPVVMGQQLPAQCPKCGNKTLCNAMRCQGCGKVTALLPPWREFTCAECGHAERARLEPMEGPHPCPTCAKPAFGQTLKCQRCGKVSAQGKPQPPGQGEARPEAFGHPMDVFPCPACAQPAAVPIMAQEQIKTTCTFCESDKLEPVTPFAVLKWEMGHDLKPDEQKVLDGWKERQKKGK